MECHLRQIARNKDNTTRLERVEPFDGVDLLIASSLFGVIVLPYMCGGF